MRCRDAFNDCVSTASVVGGCEERSLGNASCASSFRVPFAAHALRPSVWSAIYIMPLCIWTSIGGIAGCLATSISSTRQLPCVQLCRNLYCLFQFVLVPCPTRCSSSSHRDALLAKLSCSLGVPVSLSPGSLLARGRTKRL